MKSIIRQLTNKNGIRFIVYVILAYTSSVLCSATAPSCGLYGAPPCRFLPAPPGQTPACARPGKTYCEHVDNYPTLLIQHLVHKWGYEARNLIVDETFDDFAAVTWYETPIFYDPAFIFPQRHYKGNGKLFSGYSYDTPSASGRGPAHGGPGSYGSDTYVLAKHPNAEVPTYLLYTSPEQHSNKYPYAGYEGSANVTPNNPTLWLKRIVRDISRKATADGSETEFSPLALDAVSSNLTATTHSHDLATRGVSLNMDLLDIVGASKDTDSDTRAKRQSPGRSSLCQSTSQFIAPQAALNSKGNWMFVVNEASVARQMVKTELCASNTCSNLCQLPIGYNSRCEQKFVQKRLIALQGNGQNLYTDTFWFPSCCVCTIAAN